MRSKFFKREYYMYTAICESEIKSTALYFYKMHTFRRIIL